MAETLKRVRTGPSSYLKLNAEDYKAWKAAGNKEYSDGDAEPSGPASTAEAREQADDADVKPVDKPADKKSRG